MNIKPQFNLHLALTIFFGIGMVLFGILAIIAFRNNEYINHNLTSLNNKAGQEAAAKQKIADAKANAEANENPYRLYTAEQVNGGFKMSFPKNWSLVAEQNPSGQTRLDLTSHPDLITFNQGTNALNTQAFDLQLVAKSSIDVAKSYQPAVKKKTLTAQTVMVSGINGTWYQGTLDTKRHVGVIVVLPVRDKTMIIKTDSLDYLDQFKKILDSAVIVP